MRVDRGAADQVLLVVERRRPRRAPGAPRRRSRARSRRRAGGRSASSPGLRAEMLRRTYSSTSGRAIEPSTASMNSSCRSSGSSAEVLGEPDRAGERTRVGGLDRAPLQPDAAGAPRTRRARAGRCGVADRGEVPGRRHAAQVVGEALVALQRLERALPLGDVALAAALGLERARRAAGRRTGGRTAARGRGSSGRSRWRRSRRPARRARARAGRRRSARPGRRTRPGSRARARSSTASRRRRSPGPSGQPLADQRA